MSNLFAGAAGIHVSTPVVEIFFAEKDFSQKFESAPLPNVCILQQTHGDQLVAADVSNKIEADAHWTQQKNLILSIKSADCLPILMVSENKNLALAIHAGWRGVENQITLKALRQLQLDQDASLQVYIGPHIQQKSFAVDQDVAIKLLSAHELEMQKVSEEICYFKNKKYYVNLAQLIIQQLQKTQVPKKNIWLSNIDTLTDSNYYSFRRGDVGKRNYSFLFLKP